MEMTPNTYYSCLSTLETYYVNQHGVCFLIHSGDGDWPEGYTHERVDELPADAEEEDGVLVQDCGITLPDGIEEVTA